jgi:hypothetical protein
MKECRIVGATNMKKQFLTLVVVLTNLSLSMSLAARASSDSVDNFLKGKTDSLTGIDGGPGIHDYRQAPSNDPDFKIPIGPKGSATASGPQPSSDSVDNFLTGKSNILRGIDTNTRFLPESHVVDDGPIIHDYRQAPNNDPGFKIPIGPVGAARGGTHRSDVSSACKCLDQTKYKQKAEINDFLNGRSSQLCGYDSIGPSPKQPTIKRQERVPFWPSQNPTRMHPDD